MKLKRLVAAVTAAVMGTVFMPSEVILEGKSLIAKAMDSTNESIWKNAYADLLREKISNGEQCDMFDLYDVDENGIPELFISEGSYHISSGSANVYTIKNDKPSRLDLSYSDYGKCYTKNNKIICQKYNNNGGYSYVLYDIDNGESVKVQEMFYQSLFPNTNEEYKINGQTVSKTKWDDEFSKNITDGTEVGRKYKLDEATIKEIFETNSISEKWVVFHEGYRSGRLEMSSINAPDDCKIIWDKNLTCNEQVGECNQYYYDNGNWTQIGTYDILTDWAEDIIASNVDIYDKDGNIVFHKNADDCNSLSFSENKSYTYNWSVEPKIEAEDIIVFDIEEKTDYNYSVLKNYSYIKKDGLYGIIDNNGGYYCKPEYNYCYESFWLYSLFVYNGGSVNAVGIASGNDSYRELDTIGGRGGMGEFAYYVPDNNQLWIDSDLYGCNKISDLLSGKDISLWYDQTDLYTDEKSIVVREVSDPQYKDGKLVISNDVTYPIGIANKNGIIIPCKERKCRDYIDYLNGTNFVSECCAFSENGKWAYFDNKGNQITDYKYDAVQTVSPIYPQQGESTSVPIDTIYLPTEGFIAVKDDNGAGYIDTNGNEVIPTGTFAETRPVHDGKAWVKDKTTGLWGVINIEKSEKNDEQPPIYVAPETIEEPQGNVTEDNLKVLEFKIYDDHAEVVGIKSEYKYDDAAKNIIIPNEVSGVPVTKIFEKAFYNTSIASIDIPKNVVEIGKDAFDSCFYLKDMTFRNSKFEIDDNMISSRITIHGYADSTAHDYATGHYMNFVFLDNLSDWKDLYRKQLNHLRETEWWGKDVGKETCHARFYLIDIDNDGTPEVVALPAWGGTPDMFVRIYSFANVNMSEKCFMYYGDWGENNSVVQFCKSASNRADGVIKVVSDNRTSYYQLKNGIWSETGTTTEYDGWYYPNAMYEYDSESIDKAISDWEDGNRISNAPPILPEEVEEHIKWINDNPDIFFEPDYSDFFEELQANSDVKRYEYLKTFKNYLDLKFDEDIDFLDADVDIMIAEILFSEDYYTGLNNYLQYKKECAVQIILDKIGLIDEGTKLLLSGADEAHLFENLNKLQLLVKKGEKNTIYYNLIDVVWNDFCDLINNNVKLSNLFSTALDAGLEEFGCGIEMLQKELNNSKNKNYFSQLRIEYELQLDYLKFYFDTFYHSLIHKCTLHDDTYTIKTHLKKVMEELKDKLYSDDITFNNYYNKVNIDILDSATNNTIKIGVKALAQLIFAETPIVQALSLLDIGVSVTLFFEENQTNIKELANSRDMALLAIIMENTAAYTAQELANKLKSEVSNADVSNVDQTIETVRKFEYGLIEYKRMNKLAKYYISKYYEENYYMDISQIETRYDIELYDSSLYNYRSDLINDTEQALTDNEEKLDKEYLKSKIFCCSNTQNPSFEKIFDSLFEKMLLNPVTSKIDKISQGIDAIINLIKQYVICCPVDVYVYKGNELKLSIVDDKVVYDSGDCVFGIMYEDDSTDAIKIIKCPTDYEIKITGNADGTMNYYKSYYDNGTLKSSYFAADIPVYKNAVYTESTESDDELKLAIDLDTDGTADRYAEVLNTHSPVQELPTQSTTTITTSTTTTTQTTTTQTTTVPSTSSVSKTTSKVLLIPTYGDANCDGSVTAADAVLIQQSINEPDRYSLTKQGELNGDVFNSGDGITLEDADVIKAYVYELISTLPYKENSDSLAVIMKKINVTTTKSTTVITTTTTTMPVNKTSTLLGDADCDGDVDLGDYDLIMKYYITRSTGGSTDFITEQGIKNSDINHDGLVDASDASSVKSMANSYTTTTTITTTTKQTTTTEPIISSNNKLGDVNSDSIIDGRDATAVLTYYAITSTGGNFNKVDFHVEYADYNEDGIVDARDATAILTYYAKSSTEITPNKSTTTKMTTVISTTTSTVKTTKGTQNLSGMCGNNLKWEYDGNGKLTIYGNGEMESIESDYSWSMLSDKVTDIVIDAGVTSIGDQAFYKFTSLKTVTMPNTLEKIGSNSFTFCSNLVKADIPASVTNISEYAFGWCSGITAFHIDAENKTYKTDTQGAIYSYDMKKLVLVARGYSGDFVIPNSVGTIGAESFSTVQKLKSVTIGENVKSILRNAFWNCTELKNINIPQNVKYIDSRAFESCESLTEINVNSKNEYFSSINGVLYTKDLKTILTCPNGYSGTYKILDGTTTISEDAFISCSKLTNVQIPSTVNCIEAWAFLWCSSLESINIPDGISSINLSTFSGCTVLNEIIIPKSTTKIGNHAFANTGLSKIVILNDSCEIDDDKNTIPENAVIYGYPNSTAQTYAEKNNRTFIELDQ